MKAIFLWAPVGKRLPMTDTPLILKSIKYLDKNALRASAALAEDHT
jgi:hypothetical protein